MLTFKTKQEGEILSPCLLQMKCCLGPSCVLGPGQCQFAVSQHFPPETEQIRIYSPFTDSLLPLTEKLPSTTAYGRRQVRLAEHLSWSHHSQAAVAGPEPGEGFRKAARRGMGCSEDRQEENQGQVPQHSVVGPGQQEAQQEQPPEHYLTLQQAWQ